MIKQIALIFIATVFITCSEEEIQQTSCATPATVRDLTNLDGCGFVFELGDGTRLEPLRVFFCGTPPLPKEQMEDPLNDFEFVDGKKVFIDYEETESVSICMVGPMVKITCISEVQQTDL